MIFGLATAVQSVDRRPTVEECPGNNSCIAAFDRCVSGSTSKDEQLSGIPLTHTDERPRRRANAHEHERAGFPPGRRQRHAAWAVEARSLGAIILPVPSRAYRVVPAVLGR